MYYLFWSQRWDEELSRITTLRKPDEVLPQILNKTEKQIDNLWKTFTTKIGKPTGRINKFKKPLIPTNASN